MKKELSIPGGNPQSREEIAHTNPEMFVNVDPRVWDGLLWFPLYGCQREFCSRCVGKFIRFNRQVAILTPGL
jgi:hypothetical protein